MQTKTATMKTVFLKKIVFGSPFFMQILNDNEQFSTVSDLCIASLRHNMKIWVEKKQSRDIYSDILVSRIWHDIILIQAIQNIEKGNLETI